MAELPDRRAARGGVAQALRDEDEEVGLPGRAGRGRTGVVPEELAVRAQPARRGEAPAAELPDPRAEIAGSDSLFQLPEREGGGNRDALGDRAGGRALRRPAGGRRRRLHAPRPGSAVPRVDDASPRALHGRPAARPRTRARHGEPSACRTRPSRTTSTSCPTGMGASGGRGGRARRYRGRRRTEHRHRLIRVEVPDLHGAVEAVRRRQGGRIEGDAEVDDGGLRREARRPFRRCWKACFPWPGALEDGDGPVLRDLTAGGLREGPLDGASAGQASDGRTSTGRRTALKQPGRVPRGRDGGGAARHGSPPSQGPGRASEPNKLRRAVRSPGPSTACWTAWAGLGGRCPRRREPARRRRPRRG